MLAREAAPVPFWRHWGTWLVGIVGWAGVQLSELSGLSQWFYESILWLFILPHSLNLVLLYSSLHPALGYERHKGLLPRLGINSLRNKPNFSGFGFLMPSAFQEILNPVKFTPIPSLLMETKARQIICARKLADLWLHEMQLCWKSDLLWGKKHTSLVFLVLENKWKQLASERNHP